MLAKRIIRFAVQQHPCFSTLGNNLRIIEGQPHKQTGYGCNLPLEEEKERYNKIYGNQDENETLKSKESLPESESKSKENKKKK